MKNVQVCPGPHRWIDSCDGTNTFDMTGFYPVTTFFGLVINFASRNYSRGNLNELYIQ